MELLRHDRLYGKGMTRKEMLTEKVCSSNSIFFPTMKGLIGFGYVTTKNVEHSLQQIYYCLTDSGKILANIFALQKNNDEKYRKIAQEGRILWLP